MPQQGIAEQNALEKALVRQFPWASDSEIQRVTQLVSSRMSSHDFSSGFTSQLRRDAQEMGASISQIVQPAPSVPMHEGRSRSPHPLLRLETQDDAALALFSHDQPSSSAKSMLLRRLRDRLRATRAVQRSSNEENSR